MGITRLFRGTVSLRFLANGMKQDLKLVPKQVLRSLKTVAIPLRLCCFFGFLLMPHVLLAQTVPSPNSLVIWGLNQSVQSVVGKILDEGGRADHVFPPNAAIAYIPADRVDRLKTRGDPR